MGDLSTTGKGSVSDLHMSQILRACHLYHRATEGDFSSTCDGPVRAYMCDVSSGIFLTEAVGMTAWRAEAGRCPPGTQRHRTAHLPVSKYLRGNCDACSSRVRRAVKRAVDRPADAIPPFYSVFPPTERAHRPQPPTTPPPSLRNMPDQKAPLRGVRKSQNPTRLEIEGGTEARSKFASAFVARHTPHMTGLESPAGGTTDVHSRKRTYIGTFIQIQYHILSEYR